MKNTLTALLSGFLLCGCSQKQASTVSAAIDLVQAGKDTTWRDGYILHVTKRDGTSLEGVTVSAKLPTGQTQTFSADTATVSPVNDSSVIITLNDAKVPANTGGSVISKGQFQIQLKKSL